MEYEALAAEVLGCMHKAEPGQAFKAFDVSLSGETFILHYISEQAGGAVTPSQIGSAMNVSSARVAAALNALEKKSLITREIDRADRRKILVLLTDAGKAAADERARLFMQKTVETLRLLGERDASDFVRIIRKLADMPLPF